MQENIVIFDPTLVKQVGAIGKVLGEFLDEQSEKVQAQLEKQFPGITPTALRKILNAFVTSEGTKLPLKPNQVRIAGLNIQMIDFALNRLVDARIMRYDEGQYELVHDTLAQKINEERTEEELALKRIKQLVVDRMRSNRLSNAETMLTAQELNFVNAYDALLEEEMILHTSEKAFVDKSKNVLFRKRLIRGILILIAAITVLGAIMWFQHDKIKNRYHSQVKNAENTSHPDKYVKAKTNYETALSLAKEGSLFSIDGDGLSARQGMMKMDSMIDMVKPVFLTLINQGDLFTQDRDSLVKAKEAYKSALAKNYNDSLANSKLQDLASLTLSLMREREESIGFLLDEEDCDGVIKEYLLIKQNTNAIVEDEYFATNDNLEALKILEDDALTKIKNSKNCDLEDTIRRITEN